MNSGLIVCFLFTLRLQGYLSQSPLSYETFFKSEDRLLQGLDQYIRHETNRLLVIKTLSGYEDDVPLVEVRIDELSKFYTAAKDNASHVDDAVREGRARHPTSTLVGITEFVKHWEPLIINHRRYGHRLSEFLNVTSTKLPHSHNVYNLQDDIIYLHVFYNLSARDIYNGDILGLKGDPLNIEDANHLGMRALVTAHPRQALDWFELVIQENTKMQNKTNILIPRLLMKLARLHSQFGDRERAVALSEEAYALDDEDGEVYRTFARIQSEDSFQIIDFDDHVASFWKNFTEACQANATFQPPLKWYHRCRYRCSPVPYRRYREEILSIAPYVSVFYDIISNETLDYIKSSAEELNPLTHKLYSQVESMVVSHTEEMGKQLTHLAADISGLNASADKPRPVGGPLRVLHFGFSGRVLPRDQHHTIDLSMNRAGRKLAEITFYLTGVEKGGATVFPDLGLRYQPQAGSALLVFTVQPNGEDETKLTRAECALAVGEKWMITKNIHSYTNSFNVRPCARKYRGNQIGVDRGVHKFRHCGL